MNARYQMEAVNNNVKTRMVAISVNAAKDIHQMTMEKPAQVRFKHVPTLE